jgi:hypothetical protein
VADAECHLLFGLIALHVGLEADLPRALLSRDNLALAYQGIIGSWASTTLAAIKLSGQRNNQLPIRVPLVSPPRRG